MVDDVLTNKVAAIEHSLDRIKELSHSELCVGRGPFYVLEPEIHVNPLERLSSPELRRYRS